MLLQTLPILFIVLAIILIGKAIVSIRDGKTPTVFGYAMYIVESNSMEDKIMTGDLIFVNTKATEFYENDIITFWCSEENMYITHEIVSIDTSGSEPLYTTKGYNDETNPVSADWETDFSGDLIVGLYVGKSTFLGAVYRILTANRLGLAYAGVIIVFLLIIISEIANITKEVSINKQKEATKEKEEMIKQELEKLRKLQEEGNKEEKKE